MARLVGTGVNIMGDRETFFPEAVFHLPSRAMTVCLDLFVCGARQRRNKAHPLWPARPIKKAIILWGMHASVDIK